MCKFLTETAEFLAQVICARCLETSFHTTDATSGLKAPTDFTKLFLPTVQCLQTTRPNFARFAMLRNKRLKKDQPAIFKKRNKEELNSVSLLSEALILHLLLELPSNKRHVPLDTDACEAQFGCVLLQQQTYRIMKQVEEQSGLLKDADRKYDTTQRECHKITRSVLLS